MTRRERAKSIKDDRRRRKIMSHSHPTPQPQPPRLGLSCADCGLIVGTIEDAEAHEIEMNPTEDDIHGGWDTVRL